MSPKRNALREQGENNNVNTQESYTKKRAKAVIVWLAVWGLIPPGFATWLLQRGGLGHE
jgi:hypothetical protein